VSPIDIATALVDLVVSSLGEETARRLLEERLAILAARGGADAAADAKFGPPSIGVRKTEPPAAPDD
jgi:hypothetical protein